MSNKYYSWNIDIEKGIAKKVWSDDVTTEIKKSDIPADIWDALAFHGLKQKGDDAHSGKTEEGVAAMREYTEDVFDALKEGVFRRRREGGAKEPKGSDFDTLIQAISELKKVETTKASQMIAHMRPVDESEVKDDKERATENRKRGAARRQLAETKEVQQWLKKKGIIKEKSLNDALNFDE